MSARTKAARQSKTASKAKATAKAATAKAKAKPAPEPVVEETAYPSLVGIATRKRIGSDGKAPAKHQLFEVWLRNPVQSKTEVEKLAKKFSTVKTSTIRSWFSNWSLGMDGGGYYPATLRGREKDLVTALNKLAKANKA